MENRVLIIDDDIEYISQLAEILKEDAYKVGFARSAENGLEVLDSIDYDLIILDINMPRMNGFEVLEELKSNKRHRLIPVLMSSSDTHKESVLKSLTLGADDYIIKPIDADLLLDKVFHLMKIRNFIKKWGVLPG